MLLRSARTKVSHQTLRKSAPGFYFNDHRKICCLIWIWRIPLLTMLVRSVVDVISVRISVVAFVTVVVVVLVVVVVTVIIL